LTQRANGTFEVKLTPQQDGKSDAYLGRMSSKSSFTGSSKV